MGCDIHFYVEKLEKGVWTSADTWVIEDDGSRGNYDHDFYRGRNYDLFAILANVRNGYGFAGIKTGEEFNPIAPPRGLPTDVSTETKQAADQWSGDAHSHSWFTVKELLDYNWTQQTGQQGYVTGDVYAKWKFQGKYSPNWPAPDEWCAYTSGGKISESEMVKAVEIIKNKRSYWEAEADLKAQLDRKYTLVSWETSYYQACAQFWATTMPQLLALTKGNYESVRIVFWFDN